MGLREESLSFIRRVFLALVPVALLVAVGVGAPSALAAPDATVGAAYDIQTGQALAQWECKLGHVCFWDDFQGKGRRCMWENRDDDWTSGTDKCSWATSAEVKSVYNRGQSSSLTGVVFYRNTGYHDRIGCTKQGQKGDLAGTYQVRSHQWTNGRCG